MVRNPQPRDAELRKSFSSDDGPQAIGDLIPEVLRLRGLDAEFASRRPSYDVRSSPLLLDTGFQGPAFQATQALPTFGAASVWS